MPTHIHTDCPWNCLHKTMLNAGWQIVFLFNFQIANRTAINVSASHPKLRFPIYSRKWDLNIFKIFDQAAWRSVKLVDPKLRSNCSANIALIVSIFHKFHKFSILIRRWAIDYWVSKAACAGARPNNRFIDQVKLILSGKLARLGLYYTEYLAVLN